MKKEYLYWCDKCGKYEKGSTNQDAVDYTVTWIICGSCHSRRKLGMEIVDDMTKYHAQKMVREIKMYAIENGDAGSAHFCEDDLYHSFIRYIAKEAAEPYRGIAKEILKTKKIDFARWCE